ncbi:WbqC-like protein family protein [Alkalitalea saponilacus]|uniref:WbqC-like protein family protein n=1 Tax=Alkalitalea saponilacus TaxID=889453 RepID=A0A1T5F730_9BACT|nr:WbqC-like protein family protein [Alkalitalea saponilacus]
MNTRSYPRKTNRKLKKIFSTSIFPPVHYFAHLASCQEAVIERYCNYSRQTYRNRYVILGANGVLPLTVPVVKTSGKKTCTKDVEVDYDTPWNQVHWKSIEAAYNSSPYYIYYKDDIEPIFTKKWKYLLDMNQYALEVAMECTGVSAKISFTKEWQREYQHPDFRDSIHPKKNYSVDKSFRPEPYRQVFALNQPFIPNLSILDLLFNKGPESLIVLEKSIKAD